MMRDIPPLAVEGIDPWEKVQIDQATRRLAERAAAAAGLEIEEWLERAIRRACPSAFRTAASHAPPTFAPPMASPRPAQPPEIEASLAAIMARLQRRTSSQPAAASMPPEMRQTTPTEPPPLSPSARSPIAPTMRAGTASRPAPVSSQPAPPHAPPSPAQRRPPTLAERLAQQHFDEQQEEEEFQPAAFEDEAGDEQTQELDLPRRLAEPDEREAGKRNEAEEAAPQRRFKLWAAHDDMGSRADDIEFRGTASRRGTPLDRAKRPQSRQGTQRLALIAIAIALAVTAGAVTAQYLIPGRSGGSRFAAPGSTAAARLPAFTPTPSKPPPLPSYATGGSSPTSSLPGIPNLSPSPRESKAEADASAPSASTAPPTVPGLPSLPASPPSEATGQASPPSLPMPSIAPAPESTTATPRAATRPAKVARAKTAPAPKYDMAAKAEARRNEPHEKAKAPVAAEHRRGGSTKRGPVAKVEPGKEQPAKEYAAAKVAPTDPKALAPWLERRAKAGDPIAQYRLGVLYALGQGVQQDYQRAAKLFKSAAANGVAEAQYNIAVMYSEGLGIGRDPTRAVEWYEKAAAQGNANAAFNLGVAYSNGVGVAQNMAKAAEWFRHAAAAGIINAEFNLGLLYERGDGVPVSQIEAYAWFSAAAARGDRGAAQRRDRLARELSPAALKKAKARAAQVAETIRGGNLNGGGFTKASASAR